MCALRISTTNKTPAAPQDEQVAKDTKPSSSAKPTSTTKSARKVSPSSPPKAGSKPPAAEKKPAPQPASSRAPAADRGKVAPPPSPVSLRTSTLPPPNLGRGGVSKLVLTDNKGSASEKLTLSSKTSVPVNDKLTADGLTTSSKLSLTADAPAENTKGYDNASDVVTTLLNSDLMGEVHQYLATQMSTMDLSFATLDVVRSPEKYTAEQKTLTYMDLLYTHARYENFKGEADKMQDGINNSNEIDGDFIQAIAILGSDKEVQSGYVKKVLDAFSLRFNWNQLTPYENDDP